MMALLLIPMKLQIDCVSCIMCCSFLSVDPGLVVVVWWCGKRDIASRMRLVVVWCILSKR